MDKLLRKSSKSSLLFVVAEEGAENNKCGCGCVGEVVEVGCVGCGGVGSCVDDGAVLKRSSHPAPLPLLPLPLAALLVVVTVGVWRGAVKSDPTGCTVCG